jgi:hypothetical protein
MTPSDTTRLGVELPTAWLDRAADNSDARQ